MTNEQYKSLSIREFDKAAHKYESGHAGIYELCKKDYPPILEELEKEPFETLLDCGCGTGPMLSLLAEQYPERRYTGIDMSPEMVAAARSKGLRGVEFVLGDCENLPFPDSALRVFTITRSRSPSSPAYTGYSGPMDGSSCGI